MCVTWWDAAVGTNAFTDYSYTLNPRMPTASAKRPTAVRLAQVRNGTRQERTGTRRAVGPPKRMDKVHLLLSPATCPTTA